MVKSNNKQTSAFTFIDLFAGIGGLRLAFEAMGGGCIFASEYNRFCQQTYFANFKNQPAGDIRMISASDIPDHHILTAGFPCQPFSLAGISKRNNLGRPTGFADQTQGTLFFEVCRIIESKRPKAIMLENVKNLCSHDQGRTFKIITKSLKELKYTIFFQILDGKHFVPQHRERIIIIGFDTLRFTKEPIQFSFNLQIPSRKPQLKDILEAEVADKYTLSDKLWNFLQQHALKHQAAGHGFKFGIANLQGISRTLSARYYKDGSEILIPQEGKNPRRLTPRECARLQGFPDSFIIPVSDTQAYKQFGNSVVVPLMTNVANLIVTKLKELESLT